MSASGLEYASDPKSCLKQILKIYQTVRPYIVIIYNEPSYFQFCTNIDKLVRIQFITGVYIFFVVKGELFKWNIIII